MKRYLISFGAPLVALYIILAFTNWTFAIYPSEWEPASRFFSLVFYAWASGALFFIPTWRA